MFLISHHHTWPLSLHTPLTGTTGAFRLLIMCHDAASLFKVLPRYKNSCSTSKGIGTLCDSLLLSKIIRKIKALLRLQRNCEDNIQLCSNLKITSSEQHSCQFWCGLVSNNKHTEEDKRRYYDLPPTLTRHLTCDVTSPICSIGLADENWDCFPGLQLGLTMFQTKDNATLWHKSN